MKAEIVPFHPEHWDSMRARLCETHRHRAEAVAPLEDVLAIALDTSALVRTVLLDGEPECIMGCGLLADAGYPWLLKTDRAGARFWHMIRACRGFIEECLALRSVLRAEVPETDEMLRHWLAWLGFRQIGPGPGGMRWELEAEHGR